MIRNMEEQKVKLKEKINKEIEEYFKKFEICSNCLDFSIDKIEQLMMENQSKMKLMMKEANEELTSGIEVCAKKNVQNAETSLKK